MPKQFQGSVCMLICLFCLGLVPGLIYFLICYKEVGVTVQQQQQVNIVMPPQSSQGKTGTFCKNCGAEVSGDFCDKCGTKVE